MPVYDVIDPIKNRWSPYSFSPEPIEDKKLTTLFEAAGKAPSAFNEQPWLFVYATRKNEEQFHDFLGFLIESNRVWARNAYALAISFARLTSSHNGRPNRYAFHDSGMAVSNLLVQATSMDIFVHQMAGYSIEKVKEYFDLRDDIEPVAVMALGYRGDGRNISDDLLKRDEKRRPRKSPDEYLFKGILPARFRKT
jgi:nitroreductase